MHLAVLANPDVHFPKVFRHCEIPGDGVVFSFLREAYGKF